MKTKLPIIFFLFISLFGKEPVFSQGNLQLTKNAKISIITIGPYQQEIYSAFGHAGIRLTDSLLGINWIYDYGRFNFEQENFYWNFAKGKMLYSMGKTYDFNRYLQYYSSQKRYVYEQELNLRPEEVQAFFEYLENNNLPENKEYFYNYVYDNCASRIRDVVRDAISDTVIFSTSYAKKGKTVRDLMHDYLIYQPWGELIIDMGLGLQIDQVATPEVYMFLPDYVYFAFEKGVIARDSIQDSLVKKTNVLFAAQREENIIGIFTPFNSFILLFFAVGLITNRNFKTLKRSHWVDVMLFTIVGIFGWWFVFLWFGTEHLSKNNWNLLWAFPLHIPLVYFLKNEKWKPVLARVYRWIAILLSLNLVFWVVIPQPLNQALIPLVLTLILRAFYISFDLSRLSTKTR